MITGAIIRTLIFCMLNKELLDGNIVCFQKEGLYHFTSDAILLSRFAKAKNNDVVADFCSGSGIVALNFYANNKNVKSVTLIELQKSMFDLSKESIKENGLESVFSAFNMPVQKASELFREKFSLILCNPPYFKAEGQPKDDKDLCKKEFTLTLEELIKSASQCLKYGGRFCFVHLSERLAEIFSIMKKYNIEPKTLSLVEGGKERGVYLALIEGVKGGKTGLKIKETVKN